MKITFYLFRAFSLFLVLVLVACKHEPPAEPGEGCTYDCRIEEMKHYYYFKTGTWWVYEEQTTHERDTCVVYEDYSYPNGTFGFSATTSHNNGRIHYYHYESMNYPCETNPECMCRPVEVSRCDPTVAMVSEKQLFNYPHILDNYLYVNSIIGGGNYLFGKSMIENINSQVDIGIGQLLNAVAYKVETDELYSGDSTQYYFSRDIGLIKFENLSNAENWLLISHQIIN